MINFMASISPNKAKSLAKRFVDSGTSPHMRNNESLFKNLKATESERTGSIGDGACRAITVKGNVHATTFVEGKKHDVFQKGMLLIPKLSCNLVSVSICRSNDVRVTFDSGNNACGVCAAEHVRSSQKEFIAVENKNNGLFEAILCEMRTLSNMAILVERDNGNMWHYRLAHASPPKSANSIPLVNAFDNKNCELSYVCTTCKMCK